MSFKALKYTLKNPTNAVLTMGLWALGCCVFLLAGSAVRMAVAAVLAGLTVYVYWSAYRQYVVAARLNKTATLENWANSAGSAEECARRRQLLSTRSADSLIEEHRLIVPEPRYNTNGIPIMPGYSVDIAGEVYGGNELATSVRNSLTYDWQHPDEAYHRPHDM